MCWRSWLRPPYYYRVQHVYIHHVEDNGPDDSQSTMTYDRTSYLDFCRHAFKQGLDLVSGYTDFRYLQARGKKRQIRELLRGLAIWYAMLSRRCGLQPNRRPALLFVSRFLGGNMQSLVAFWQHGLVDPNDAHEPHGHSVDYAGRSTATSATTTTWSITTGPVAIGAPTTRCSRGRWNRRAAILQS